MKKGNRKKTPKDDLSLKTADEQIDTRSKQVMGEKERGEDE